MVWRRFLMQAMNASEAELTKKLAESGPMKMLALKTHELVTRLRSPNDPRYHHLYVSSSFSLLFMSSVRSLSPIHLSIFSFLDSPLVPPPLSALTQPQHAH
jgi:hypothetical protein